MNTKLQTLIASLTKQQAAEYSRETDKLIWIEVNLLDPNDLSRCHAERVEDALIKLL